MQNLENFKRNLKIYYKNKHEKVPYMRLATEFGLTYPRIGKIVQTMSQCAEVIDDFTIKEIDNEETLKSIIDAIASWKLLSKRQISALTRQK